MNLSLRKMSLIVFTILTFSAPIIATEASDTAIIDRIKPVGSVYLDGEKPKTQKIAAAPRSGETVYNTSCGTCHNSGLMGAPKKGDAKDWAERSKQGDAVLAEHAIKGFNAMPAKGTCMDCSDDEIIAAINYMMK